MSLYRSGGCRHPELTNQKGMMTIVTLHGPKIRGSYFRLARYRGRFCGIRELRILELRFATSQDRQSAREDLGYRHRPKNVLGDCG
jgi:hypothetical protein